ncbi:MAG: hypothetical protein ABR529_03990 [Actinomycetota bacterium]
MAQTPSTIQRTYLVLLLGNTLAAYAERRRHPELAAESEASPCLGRGWTLGSRLWVLIALVVLSVLLLPAPQAYAWANGTNGCNSFGAHDWILKKAIEAVGSKASWVRLRVALRATDDPDCKDGLDHASGTWWHVYDRWGSEYGEDADPPKDRGHEFREMQTWTPAELRAFLAYATNDDLYELWYLSQ